MMNIFEVFLPQLLRYPNPNDPLNGEAAALLMRHPKEYELKVKGKWSHCLCLPLVEGYLMVMVRRVRTAVRDQGGCRLLRSERRRRRRSRDERHGEYQRR